MSGKVLAFGASGTFGGMAVAALATRGAVIRGFVRSSVTGARALVSGTAELATGDLTDGASIARALDGIERVFYLAPAFMPNEADVGKAVVSACISAGVRRIVFSSVIHPIISALANHTGKATVEEAVLASNLEYSFLHPALFFQNYRSSRRKIIETGTLGEPWSSECRFSRVDYRDVAEVAAIALTEDQLLYGTFELCAEDWLNRHDVASMIGRIIGREIAVKRIDPDSLGDEARPRQPMFDHYDRVGPRGNPLTLEAILGRRPRSLDSFFRELADEEDLE